MTAAHHLIQRKAASKRTPLLDDQAAHMAQLIEHLAKSACDHFGVRDVSELRDDQHQAFCALPAYDMFIAQRRQPVRALLNFSDYQTPELVEHRP